MLEKFLIAMMTALGNVVLAYFDRKQARTDSDDAAVAKSSNEELKDVGAIADEQAKNNVIDRGDADDVAARLRARLTKTGTNQPRPRG